MVTPKGSVSTEGETPSFCPTLQGLDRSTLGDAVDVNPVTKPAQQTAHTPFHDMLPHFTECFKGSVTLARLCKSSLRMVEDRNM